MIDLISFHARICPTAAGVLIHDDKVLLVKHKKLKMWLPPGGHIEAGEQPHQAAEREFFEETNIKVIAISPIPMVNSLINQYLPVPFVTNIHWISQENYQARLQSGDPEVPHGTPTWPKGCEQHLGISFLVKPIAEISPRHDPNESDGIDWFELDQLDTLETTDDIRQEIRLAIHLKKDL
jgi:8-oxo-dGTP pyrophosphatase MutT (NUDIX family)